MASNTVRLLLKGHSKTSQVPRKSGHTPTSCLMANCSTSNEDDLPFDHVLSLSPELPISTLYVDIDSPLFAHFHQTLSETARSGRTSYRIRYRPSTVSDKPLAVSGYGVELSLKRTDYIVIDDRNSGDEETKAEKSTAADRVSLETDEVSDLKPLSSSELLGLGLKAGSFIMNSEDPFETLEKLSQDFPKHSHAISKLNYSDDFFAEHRFNRGNWLSPGYNGIWMNGLQIESRQMDAYTMLDKLRHERKLINSFKTLGLNAAEAISMLSHSAISQARYTEGTQRYDYRDTIEGGRTIIWLNNIEKDSRYSDWPSYAGALLQPTYPGQLPMVKRDIHNAIMPIDFSDIKGIEEIVETLMTLIQRKISVRFGIVPVLTTPEAQKQAKVIYYLLDKYGLGAVMAYFQASLEDRKHPQYSERRFKYVIEGREHRKNREELAISDILEGEEYQNRIDSSKAYLARLGADGKMPPAFVNGVAISRDDSWMQGMSNRIGADMQLLQRRLFEDLIADDVWIAGQYLEGAVTHRNPLIVPEDEDDEKVLNIGEIVSKNEEAFANLPTLPASDDAMKQFWAHVIVVADFDSERGAHLLEQAVEYQQAQTESTIVFLHNPSPDTTINARSSKLFEIATKRPELDADDIASLKTIHTDSSTWPDQMAQTFWERMQPMVASLGLTTDDSRVILNGRSIGPISEETKFEAEDFTQLLNYERLKRITPVNTALADTGLEERLESPLAAAKLTSMLALSSKSDVPEGIFGGAPSPRADTYSIWQSNHTAITVGSSEGATIRLVASVDPTSENAQRYIPILRVLSELEGVSLKLFINPRERMEELPVKRFYRYVLNPRPIFHEDGSLRSSRATFEGLPKDALLNLAMNVPPAWLVAPKESVHDLDNIKLSALKAGQDVNAIYELENILIEGHTRDTTAGQPPRGVQLLLGTEKDAHFADTLIMANLGYFQFKANPGYWKIQLKPGRSQEIFQIDSIGADGTSGESTDKSTEIALMSFQGATLFPTLSRKTGMEQEDVLETGSGNVVAKASKLASGFLSNVGLGKKSEHADINIFSVASGHLYERMLNIMMVSVMRNTKHTVKFWFIEQFLSPSFKKSLPKLAANYGFEFEMVTYKWPHWLRGQKEKQREIWGYKILFLDVLFPLSLDKVIFVDADQIVRTDMYDLVTHDLQGAPYGFTPMCDSRTEMEGFRFWKQGYWKNFLRGLPYHISALYVVDLKAFRQMAAGDRLRQQYHQLSADPNSLSNLDQDLPNHMQMALPIHSLPQNWLWCETWCSDEALKDAKTIDLCNNPQTKEPKLDRARRQVPEWTEYDNEIAGVLADVQADGDSTGASIQEELDSANAKSAEENKDASIPDSEPGETSSADSARTRDEL